ncbi:MAG: SDR family NAD(P)-dependent oxidoreductase [Terriglobales bacterium]
MRGLKDHVALVTGATGLLGSAVCGRLAEEGVIVGVASREKSRAEAWIHAQANPSLRFVPLQLDLSRADSIRAGFDALARAAAPPTILVCNASQREGLATPLPELSHESFGTLYAVDVAGHFLCAREMVERLGGRGPASIVLLSSIYAVAGVDAGVYPSGMLTTPPQYAAAKAALLGLTHWMAAQWGSRGVRVNALVPGGMRAPARQSEEFVRNYSAKTMLGRMATPEEIAAAVAFLSSEEASYITGGGMMADGGFTAW